MITYLGQIWIKLQFKLSGVQLSVRWLGLGELQIKGICQSAFPDMVTISLQVSNKHTLNLVNTKHFSSHKRSTLDDRRRVI